MNNKNKTESKEVGSETNRQKDDAVIEAAREADKKLLEAKNKLAVLAQELSPDVSEKVPAIKDMVDELNKRFEERDKAFNDALKMLIEKLTKSERLLEEIDQRSW